MSIFWISLLYYLFLVTVLVEGGDPACTGKDQCTCITADNQIIDLTSLGNVDDTAAFMDMQAQDGYMYSYNPCYPFTEIACQDQSVCQIPTDRTTSYPAGDASSAKFTNDGLNNHVLYTSTDSSGTTRSTDVTLVCDEGAVDATVSAEGEKGTSTYFLTLTTKCACPNGCVNNPPTDKPNASKGGLGIGSILCICVLCISVVYLAGGIIFLRVQRQASGLEMIPNSAFWASIPGCIKDGFGFTFSKLKGNNSGYQKC